MQQADFSPHPGSTNFDPAWIVTVDATSTEEATAKGVQKLSERASKVGAKTPEGGWQLVRIKMSHGIEQEVSLDPHLGQ